MKGLLHWMVCHTVVIVLLLFLMTAIYFRGPLFGIYPEVEAEPAAEAAATAEPETPAVEPESAVEQQPAPQTMPPSEEAVVAEGISETEPVGQSVIDVEVGFDEKPDSENLDTANAGTSEDELPVQTSSEQMQQEQPVFTEPVPETQTPENIQRESPETLQLKENYQFRPEQVQPVEDSAGLQQDLLQQARRAYWNDDLYKARTLYQAFINLNPENPDGYGELGNLLSTQGNLKSASYMYQKASELLLKQGRTEEAEKLKEVLSSIEVIQKSYD